MDGYQKVKKKLNDYIVPKIIKQYGRYMYLKSRSEAGEAIVAFATRLREKAHGCDFGSSNDDGILEHLIHQLRTNITWLFVYCKGGNFNIHIWVWFGYFICEGREIRFYL